MNKDTRNLFRKSFILRKNNNYKNFESSISKLKKDHFLTKENTKTIQSIKNFEEIRKKRNLETIKTPVNTNLNNQKVNIFQKSKILEKNNLRENNFNRIDPSKNLRNGLVKRKDLSDKKTIEKKVVKNNHEIEDTKSDFQSKNYKNIVCYENYGIKKSVMEDAARGFGIKKLQPLNSTPCDGLNVVMGILRGSEILIKNCIKEKKDFLYIDHAYFKRGHNNGKKSFYRTILNDLHCNFIDENANDSRLKMFNVNYKKWKKDGSLILLCPPTDAIINFYGNENWLDDIIIQLRKYTDRPFKIKFKKIVEAGKIKNYTKRTSLKRVNNHWANKYENYVCERPIQEDYEKAWCLITFSSTIALEAILNGIPVVCGEECCAYPVAQTLDKIENPEYPDIYKWLCTLANHQFSREEMANGYAWKFLGL